MGASGLQRRQGARSLRDRQLPTALPALDRTSTRRHGADNRPKGGSALRPAGNHFAAGRFPVPIPVGGTVLDSSFRNGTPFSLEVRRKHSPGGPFSIKMAKLVPPTKVCPFTSALIGGALWCLFRRNVPPERWNCFQKDKLERTTDKMKRPKAGQRQREKFSRWAGERRRFGVRADSARALEPFTVPACVEGVRGRIIFRLKACYTLLFGSFFQNP